MLVKTLHAAVWARPAAKDKMSRPGHGVLSIHGLLVRARPSEKNLPT
jgi:hypothetical protein